MKTVERFSRISDPDRTPRLDDFFDLNITDLDRTFQTEPHRAFVRKGEQRAVKLFRLAAERVPAYRDFLKRKKFKWENVRTTEDFRHVPPTSKKSYVEKYPLKDRSFPDSNHAIFAASSGTTGNPVFWPRGHRQELEAAVLHELVYRALFGITPRDDALIAIGFPLGVYVSGIATTIPTYLVSAKGYRFSLVTSGLAKDRLLDTIRANARTGQQILLIGHPFFVKDVAESGAAAGINWKKYRMGAMLCSEGFIETWRDYLAGILGITDPARILNTYGSSEFLLMATETPLSVRLRRAVSGSDDLRMALFSDEELLPGIFQFNPMIRHIESVDGELLHTAASGTPLIRYATEDRGAVVSYERALALLEKKQNRPEAKSTGHWHLPFVALYGRKGNTVLYYGINIYPELLRNAFDESPDLLKCCTGKFTLRSILDARMDPVLEINIELRPDAATDPKWKKRAEEHLHRSLLASCIEYRFLVGSGKKIRPPKVVLWPYQHKKYFTPGMKPKYISS